MKPFPFLTRISFRQLLLFLPILYSGPFYAQSFTYPNCGFNGGDGTAATTVCNTNLVDLNTHHNDDMVPQGITRTLKIKTNIVLLQRQDGSGNFSPSTNAEHKEFLDDTFERINAKMANLEQENCNCTMAPEHYNNIHVEFVPTYVEIQNEFYWNHLNDPNPTIWNSANKSYLNEIHDLLISEGYEPGFDVFVSTNKAFYEGLVLQGLPHNPNNYPDPYGRHWYSALRSINLDQPAFWHCPDLFLDWYDNRYNRGEDWPWYVNLYERYAAGGFLHEYGHSFLPTTGHQNGCDNNVMNGSGNVLAHPRTSFTGCQARDIYLSLMAGHLRKYVVCEDVLDATHEIVVDTDETWQNNLRLYTNVRIQSSATLTVQCSLYLQPKTKILVERGARLIVAEDALIANGGVCEDESPSRWEGIRVAGNNSIVHKAAYALESYTLAADDHGIVLLLANATIRDANNALLCYKDEALGDSDYWGAYIRASGANFINNKRSIGYMRSNFDSKSEIINCTFEGGNYGITNWKSDKVSIRGCTFNHQKSHAVYSINAGMQVLHNTFNGIDDAIEIENTTLLNHPYIISRNDFVDNARGVKASVANNLLISNNDFTLGIFGVSLMGQGQAVIQNNRFENLSGGVDLQSAGKDFTPVGCNIFSTCTFGLNPSGDNLGLQYFNNQNDNNFDAYIQADKDGNPALISDQGSSFN